MQARIDSRTARVAMFALVLVSNGCGGGSSRTPPEPATTAVGTPSGAPMSNTIGANGGSLVSADGKLTLIVPAGALASDTPITITPITNTAHGGVGVGYRLEPDGLVFAEAATLAFTYDPADLGGSAPETFGAAFQTTEGHWQWLGAPTFDASANELRVRTTHFTDFSMVRGVQLLPRSADVHTGESAALRLVVCHPQSVDPDDLQPLAYACDTDEDADAILNIATEWSVNGVPGGSSATGTVRGSGTSASYTAPDTKPSSNPVAVSARVDFGSRGKQLVVSNLRIVDDAASYAGTVTWSSPVNGFTNGEVDVTFTLATRYSASDNFIGTGTISADVTISDCDTVRVSAPLAAATTPDDWHLYSFLDLRNESDDTDPKTFDFQLIGEPKSTTFECGDPGSRYTLDYDVVLLTFVAYCPPGGYPAYTEASTLSGSYACAGSNQNVVFSFARQ